MPHRMLSSIHGLKPLDVLPQLFSQNVSKYCQMSPGRQKHPKLRTNVYLIGPGTIKGRKRKPARAKKGCPALPPSMAGRYGFKDMEGTGKGYWTSAP